MNNMLNVAAGVTAKSGYLVALFLAFVQPIEGLFYLVGWIVFVDMLVAVYTVLKLEGWKLFRSGKLFNTIPKLIMYFTVLLVFHATDMWILKGGQFFGLPDVAAKATAVFICFIELKSIDEKVVKLGRKSVFLQARDFFKTLMKFKTNINE